MGREVVVITGGRLDLGTWERIFQGLTEGLARESRRPPPQADIGQDYREVGGLRAILRVIAQGSGMPQRDGLSDRMAGHVPVGVGDLVGLGG